MTPKVGEGISSATQETWTRVPLAFISRYRLEKSVIDASSAGVRSCVRSVKSSVRASVTSQ